jgi:AcrR family transcriptional regulator
MNDDSFIMPRVSEDRLEARRQLILHAAVACFARDGFHKTTMSDIAAEAGISDGLAYRYFSGKEEIIREVARLSAGQSQAAMAPPLDPDDVAGMLDLLMRSSFGRFALAGRDTTLRLRFRAWAEALDDESVREQVVSRWEHHIGVAERLWMEAQRDGLVDRTLDPRAVARVTLAIHDGLGVQWSLDRDLDIERCQEVVIAMLRGRFWSGDGRAPTGPRTEGGARDGSADGSGDGSGRPAR